MSKSTPDHCESRALFNLYILKMAKAQLTTYLEAHKNAIGYDDFKVKVNAEIAAINVRIKQWKKRNE
jgi:hypothetical protein